jgi:hypothetical protein
MAGDVITTDLSVRAKRTLDGLLQRRDQLDTRTGEPRQLTEDALERLAVASAAIDDAWAEGARRVEELQREAERVRDEVRARAVQLEAAQATALLELAGMWPVEDLAVLLGVPVDQVAELVRDAQAQVSALPAPRSAG